LTNHDARDISALLAGRIRELVRVLLSNGREQGGSWRVGRLDGQDGSSGAIGAGAVVGAQPSLDDHDWVDAAPSGTRRVR
jgi:hypothetical protein